MSSYDLVIRNGRIIDGTGNIWYKKDIGIIDGKIKKIGIIKGNAKKVINANGKVVSPGFIDLHNHSDTTILPYPNAESSIMQGITTAVVGNCGVSMAPINKKNLNLLKKYLSFLLVKNYDYKWDWQTIGEYYKKVEKQGTSLNIAPLVGFGVIRLAVKGFDSSEASEAEIIKMKKLLEQSIEDGVFGMSTGLIYPPGCYSTTDELIELGKVLNRYGLLYATHMRNEGDRLLESIEEAIKIAEECNIAVEVSHHKVLGKYNWGKVNASLREMKKARNRGIDISCDVYPYIACSTTITSILPIWVLEGGVGKAIERLKDIKLREKIKKDIIDNTVKGENWIRSAGWNGIFIGECQSRKEYEGRSLENILTNQNRSKDLFDGFFDLLLEIDVNAMIVMFAMDEEDVKTVISNPLSAIGSDSWSVAPIAGGKPHPRMYGTFPRVLGKYVREENLLTLESAIRKMTSFPATKIGLKKRGIIEEGYYADIVIFDPDNIKDKATYAEPLQYPEGIEYVIVNGEIAVDNGEITGRKSGKILKKESV